MNIVSRDIYRPWSAINNGDIHRLFDVALPPRRTKASWMPAVDIEEQEGHFVITADLPGIDIDDVQIMMSEGVLSLEGKRASCREDNAGEVRRAERVILVIWALYPQVNIRTGNTTIWTWVTGFSQRSS